MTLFRLLAVLPPSVAVWPVALGLVLATPAAGAEAPDAGPAVATPAELEAVLVNQARTSTSTIAGGAEESRATAPANIQIITYEQISQRRYRSVAEALQDVPGLYIIDDLVMPSVGVRGITGGVGAGSRIVRVMINGVQVDFRPDLTAFLGPEYLPIEAVERIEVAKGPLSALYGANAFLATVNIITRKDGAGASTIAEVGLRGRLTNGNAGYGGSVVAGFDRKDSVLVASVSGDFIDRSGLFVPLTFQGTSPDTIQPRFQQYFNKASQQDFSTPLTGLLTYTLKGARSSFEVQGGLQQLDAKGEFQLNSVLTHNSRMALGNRFLHGRYEYRFLDWWAASVKAGFSQGDNAPTQATYRTGNNDSYFHRRSFYRAFDGALDTSVVPTSWLSVRAGFDGNYEYHQPLFFTEVLNVPRGVLKTGNTIDRIGATVQRTQVLSNAGLYALATASFLNKRLAFTLNGRGDFPNVFPAQFSWRASAAFAPTPELTTKVVIGRAFETPSATLLYAQPGFPTGNNVIGNRTTDALPLVPQTVTSVEGIVSFEVLGRLSIDLSLFAQQVDNFIDFRPTGNNFVALNITTPQRALGGELGFNFVLSRLTLNGAFTLQAREVTNDSLQTGALDAFISPAFPGYKGFLNVNLSFKEAYLNANATVRAVGPRYASFLNVEANNRQTYALPAYGTIDVALSSVRLALLGGTETSFSLSVRNLLDTRFVEPGFGGIDIPTVGRTFLLEMRESF